MPTVSDDSKRIIIPRWRNVYDKSSSIILFNEKHDSNTNNNIASGIYLKKEEFKNQKNFSSALEVVNTAFSIGEFKEAIEEAKFIKSLDRNLPSAISSIIKNILKQDFEDNLLSEDELKDPLLGNIYRESGRKIAELRKRVQRFYYNPLLWLELSRLYAILGQIKKADNASQVALQLSQNSNRLITRSVSRFYVHKGEFEKAQYIVRKSPFFEKDPWLISCDISYSQALKRRSSSIKLGMKMIENRSHYIGDLTELAAALGTDKYFLDKQRDGKNLFQIALKAPNENSFAQAKYFIKNIDDKLNLIEELPNNFEAKALNYFEKDQFEKSFIYSFHWLADQPFSKRAAYFNSYLLSGILENHSKAVEFGLFSLRANPKSFLLNNNIAFSYASLGNIKSAKLALKRANQNVSSDSQRVILYATEGMILYREGLKDGDKAKIERGREFYLKAIKEAEIQKNNELRILAIINFVREEYLVKAIDKETLNSIIKNIEENISDQRSVNTSLLNLKKLLNKSE